MKEWTDGADLMYKGGPSVVTDELKFSARPAKRPGSDDLRDLDIV